MKKTKNKPDSTTRNITAAKKREAKLEKRIEELDRRITFLFSLHECFCDHVVNQLKQIFGTIKGKK